MAAGAKKPPYKPADRRTGTDQQKNMEYAIASCFKQIHHIKSLLLSD